jgi:error-prone DNA polymerase
LSLLREQLSKLKLMPAADLAQQPSGRLVRACGLVTMRQQPGTAKGVMFVTLEDETGSVNVIVWKRLRERQRTVALQSRLLAVYGVWQRDPGNSQVCHLIAGHLRDLSPLLGELVTRRREFH